ncbi:MAG: bifunctional trypsin-like peptidase domain-containing/SEL1-like repeat protein [Lentisphaerae bacterium]|nr:bifunctional trypsin-like peptidase domain-containing/SEL1-like repeat protein [Lentisphaerota bacterium]
MKIARLGLCIFICLSLISFCNLYADDFSKCAMIRGDGGRGSGFFIHKNNQVFVVTCNHIALNLKNMEIYDTEGKKYACSKVLSATDRDIAIIPIDNLARQEIDKLQFFHIAQSFQIDNTSDSLICYGDSEGRGVIVSCQGKILGKGGRYIEVDTPFVQGNSGGPLVDKKTGKVIAVASLLTGLQSNQWVKGTRFDASSNQARRFGMRLDNLDWATLKELTFPMIKDTHTAKTLFRQKDYTNAYIYSRKADFADSEIQYQLGFMLFTGKGCKQNTDEAMRYLKNAQDQENPNALFFLASQGIYKDNHEKVQKLRKAAFNGHTAAQMRLWAIYSKGIPEIQPDQEEANKWLRTAAASGDPTAQSNLGCMYTYGINGFPKDESAAFKWLKLADEKSKEINNPSLRAFVFFELGRAYCNGHVVKEDVFRGGYYLQKAAELDNASAQFMLGIMYYMGKGVAQDHKKAVFWYRKAAAQGNTNAKKALKMLGY